MTAFLLTTDNDLALTDGKLSLVRGVVEKAQKAKTLLGLATGEWFLDLAVGVPWFGLVIGQKPDLEIVKRLVTSVLLSIPGIADVSEMRASFDGRTRAADVTWRAFADDGEEIPGGSNPFTLKT